MSIVDRIYTAIYAHQEANHTLEDPTAIYLGAEEYYQLRADLNARLALTHTAAGIDEFYGIPVYQVISPSHLRVC